MIGLIGAHRTGKTTLAKAWVEWKQRSGYHVKYLTISAGTVIQETLGVDCGEITSIDDRLKVQRALTDRYEATMESHTKFGGELVFVIDRTPLDIAAYTLAEAGQHLTMDQAKEVCAIVERCYALTEKYLSYLIFLPPVLPYVVEDGKPPLNAAYQQHISALMLGLMSDGARMPNVTYSMMPEQLRTVTERSCAIDQVVGNIGVYAFQEVATGAAQLS
ncbi:MAG: ATP-binding protein [Rhodobacterales bacterium]|nr:ATP-binding protein [Rhodobacterales bacterium]